MIYHLKRHQIIDALWNQLISNSKNGIVYAYTWYLDIMSPAWEALVEDNYVSAMPLCINKKLGIKYVFLPFFTQKFAIYCPKTISDELLVLYLKNLQKIVRFADFRLDNTSAPSIHNLRIDYHNTYELDLNRSYNTIAASYRTIHRKNLKIAQKANILVSRSEDAHFSVNELKRNLLSKNLRISDLWFKRLACVMNEAIKLNAGKLYLAYSQQNEFLAFAFFFITNNKAVINHSTTELGRKSQSMYYLIDNFIREHQCQNLFLDFAGSNIKGIADFNAGFGAVALNYIHIYYNNLPFFLKWLKR